MRQFVLRLLAVLLVCVPLPALADIGAGLDSMFMTTGNEPAIYQSQRRMGFDLGTFRLRAPINKVNVINLTPPTFRAGCGGVDLFGGSFTFIDEEQFRQMLRQIGANALGYAFKLALATMCEKCDSILTGLQNSINELNRMQVDSCRWASGLVNDFAGAMDFKVNEEAVQEGSASAMFQDGFAAIKDLFDNPGGATSGGDASGADPTKRDKVGNYTWNALLAANAGGRFSFPAGNYTHNEVLMSIAGTFIKRAPNAAETEEGELNGPISARIKYKDLKEGKTAEAGANENLIPLYACDELIQCLDPTDGPDWSFAGINVWATGMLQQAADHMANPATASTDHVAVLQNFLATLPLPVVRHMQVLQGDDVALRRYVDQIDEYVAAAYSSTLALAMVDVIEAAYDRSDSPLMPDNVKEALREFAADAKKDRTAVEQQYSDVWLRTEQFVATFEGANRQPGNLVRRRN